MLYIIIITLLFFIYYNFYIKENFYQHQFCVIVTTYNPGVDYIEKCLKSIETQNFKNYRLCVVEDASTKERKEVQKIIKKYCKRNNWKYIFNKKNIGVIGGLKKPQNY